jgi:diguanylate cyclase (GGDEF)-like protein/PAS domain S-box-containing protein
MTMPRFVEAFLVLDARLSIRTRLVLLLAVLSVPFMVYLALSTSRQADQEIADAEQRMLSFAHLTAAKLDAHVGSVEQLLAVLSYSVGSTPEDAPKNNALLRKLAATLPTQINTVSIWTVDGANIGALDPSLRLEGINISNRAFFKDALASADMVIQGPRAAPSNGELVVLLARSIRRGGGVHGVVVASIKLKPLQALLTPGDALPRGTVITVTDAGGVVMARSLDSENWIGRNLLKTSEGGLAESLQRRDGVREGASADGVRRIAGFTMTAKVPWLVYVGVPMEVAMAPVRARLGESIALGGVMMLIGLGFAAVVAEGIASPLRRLGEHAAAFERGDLAHRSLVRQGGEIGRLASTLNRAADALLQRTAAMQASQDQLHQITDNLPALIAYLDTEHRFRFANQVHKKWLGIEAESLIGQTPEKIHGEAGYAKVRHHVVAALAGTRQTYERDLMTTAGSRRIEVVLMPHFTSDGGVQGLFSLTRDITERRDAEVLRVLSEERLSLALDGSSLALFDWDIAQDRLYHSPQAAVMRGYPAEETTASALSLGEQVHPEDRELMVARIRAAISGKVERYRAEFRVSTASGGWIWLLAKGRVVERDERGRAARLAGTYADVTQMKSTEKRLRYLAEFDVLTGLPNRGLFMDRLDQALARSRRSGKPMALLFLDIDRFKGVNDTLGHEAGDDVLKAFARAMRACVRSSDTVARLGGDEFTIILEELSSVDEAETVARKLVDKARMPVASAGRSVTVSASIGIAMVSADEWDAASILRRADAALYEAKRLGRNRYAFIGNGRKNA